MHELTPRSRLFPLRVALTTLCSSLAVSVAAPACAVTLPPLELEAGQTRVGVGLPYVAIDHAFSDRFMASLLVVPLYPMLYGATASAVWSFWRAPTWQAAVSADFGAYSLTIAPDNQSSSGFLGSNFIAGTSSTAWAGPSLSAAWQPMPRVSLRGSLGLLFGIQGSLTPLVLPGAEIGYRPWTDWEVGLGFPTGIVIRHSW
jgi:hypothetical protein